MDDAGAGTLRPIGKGFGSRVFLRSDGVVVRVSAHAQARRRHEREAKLLAAIAPRIRSVALARPTLLAPSPAFPFGASTYPWIAGEALRPALLAAGDRARLTRDVAAFASELHAIDRSALGELDLPGEPADAGALLALWQTAAPYLRGVVAAAAHDRLCRRVASVAAALREGAARPAVLVHGDLWYANMLVADGRLVGVLDFETATFDDPLVDLVTQRYVDRAFAAAVASAYGRGVDDAAARLRGDCLMVVREVRGLAEGVESGEVDADAVGKVVHALSRACADVS